MTGRCVETANVVCSHAQGHPTTIGAIILMIALVAFIAIPGLILVRSIDA